MITGTRRVLRIDLTLPATTGTAVCTTTVHAPDLDHPRLAVYAPPRTVVLMFDAVDGCYGLKAPSF